ncbi:hypothetical protein KY285_008547 [Solanum tuberosum]|nr:hypothetical protein KY285_008547 [Solanum tuberosum]
MEGYKLVNLGSLAILKSKKYVHVADTNSDPINETVSFEHAHTVPIPNVEDNPDPNWGWVKLVKRETEKETNKWKAALIVYVVGDTPGYNYMSKYIAQNWNKVSEPDIFYHEDGYYVVRFKSMGDPKEILHAGPYSINNRPSILKQWDPNFDFNKEFLTEIPLWVKFLSLPMSCWSCDSLSHISSAIGIPKYVDNVQLDKPEYLLPECS